MREPEGYKETIINGKTGYLINDIDEEKLAKEIKHLSEKLKTEKVRKMYRKECVRRAKEFDTQIFIEKIKEEIL